MGFIRNLLALIGLLVVVGIGLVVYKYGPTLYQFDSGSLVVYGNFAEKLLESGDPGVAMTWEVPVQEGISADEVVEALKSQATQRNFLFVGESPLYQQIKAVTGEDYRYVNFLSFCDARVGKALIDYHNAYTGFMPCRIAVVQRKDGGLSLYSMNLDLMIYGGRELPPELKQQAIKVRSVIYDIMKAAAAGEF